MPAYTAHPWDIAIVGAGPAGLCTAMHVVEEAAPVRLRVVVLEGQRLPRSKPCGGAVGQRGLRVLEDLGMGLDVPSVPVRGFSLRTAGALHVRRPGDIGRVVRRADFDGALARAAKDRGIRILDEVAVEDLRIHRHGVTLRTESGELRARVVVAADGAAGPCRRLLGLDGPSLWGRAAEVRTPRLPDDPPVDLLHMDASDGSLDGYHWTFPCPGEAPTVSRGVYRFGGGRPGLRALLTRELAERGFDPGDPALRPRVFPVRALRLRSRISRPRALLVGEAAGVDPLLGEGVAPALLYGRLAGRFLARALGRDRLDLSGWRRTVLASPLGLDLAWRRLAAPLAYGPLRPLLERRYDDVPDVMLLFAAAFGGPRPSPGQVAGITARLARSVARGAIPRSG